MRYEYQTASGAILESDEYAPCGETRVIDGERAIRIFSVPALARHTMARHSRRPVKGLSLPKRGRDVVEAPAYDSEGVPCFANTEQAVAFAQRRTDAGVPTKWNDD